MLKMVGLSATTAMVLSKKKVNINMIALTEYGKNGALKEDC